MRSKNTYPTHAGRTNKLLALGLGVLLVSGDVSSLSLAERAERARQQRTETIAAEGRLLAGRYACTLTSVTDLHREPSEGARKFFLPNDQNMRDTIDLRVKLTMQPSAREVINRPPAAYETHHPRTPSLDTFMQTSPRLSIEIPTTNGFERDAKNDPDVVISGGLAFPKAEHPIGATAAVFVGAKVYSREHANEPFTKIQEGHAYCGSMEKTTDGWQQAPSTPMPPVFTERTIL